MINFKDSLTSFIYWANNEPNKPFLKQPIGDDYITFTYGESLDIVKRLSNYLISNYEKIQHVGILSKNSAYWILSDLAIMMSGGVSVPLYATLNSEQVNQILNHGDCDMVFLGKLDGFDEIWEGIDKKFKIITTPDAAKQSENNWEKIIKETKPKFGRRSIPKTDILSIIYTSGTTGNPKGVMINQASVTSAINTAWDIAFLGQSGNRFISYLPLCHIAERDFVEFASLACGGTIYFVESLDTFEKNLKAASPTHFLAVPRIWQKFKEGILKKLGSEKRVDTLLSIPILSSILKGVVRKNLGLKNAKITISGAAKLPKDIVTFFMKFGIVIQEAYGMTENLGLTTFMRKDRFKLGTVGQAWDICEIKIDSKSGEILMKGPNLMVGYYKEKKMTTSMYDKTWLKTGDIGSIDHEGYLSIEGRVKDQFKTSKGMYVSPNALEEIILKDEIIEQAIVLGNNLPQPIALVRLNEKGLSLSKSEIENRIEEIRKSVNTKVKKYENLDSIRVVEEEWSIENGFLTPTLKMKRMFFDQYYSKL
ncbi:MAG: hypothetical protein RIR51_1476 [Bacteroidota bacterium]